MDHTHFTKLELEMFSFKLIPRVKVIITGLSWHSGGVQEQPLTLGPA